MHTYRIVVRWIFPSVDGGIVPTLKATAVHFIEAETPKEARKLLRSQIGRGVQELDGVHYRIVRTRLARADRGSSRDVAAA